MIVNIKNIPDLGGSIAINLDESSDWTAIKACVMTFISENFPATPIPKDLRFGTNFRPDTTISLAKTPYETLTDLGYNTITVNWVSFAHTGWLSVVKIPRNCICGNLAVQRCGGCKIIGYCSKKCQHEDWNSHKKLCKRLTIRNNI